MTELRRVAGVAARLVDHRWRWAEENRNAVAANWDKRRAITPLIFNGRVLMIADTRVVGDVMEADFFATDYANLLAHIDGGFADASVANGFAMGALQGSDGGYILGTMAAGTANAGRLYFPAGTPDLSDVSADGAVDLATSILREIREETGLEPGADSLAPDWTIARHAGRIAFMRGVRLAETSDAARARIEGHLAADPDPELAGVTIVRSAADIDESRMPAFLPVYLRWALGEAGAQR